MIPSRGLTLHLVIREEEGDLLIYHLRVGMVIDQDLSKDSLKFLLMTLSVSPPGDSNVSCFLIQVTLLFLL